MTTPWVGSDVRCETCRTKMTPESKQVGGKMFWQLPDHLSPTDGKYCPHSGLPLSGQF